MSTDLNELPKWFVGVDKAPLGFVLPSKYTILSHDEAVSISNQIIQLDGLTKGLEFEYWQSNFQGKEREVAHLQVLDGRRIVDTRYISSLTSGLVTDSNMLKLLALANNSYSLTNQDNRMVVVSLERYKQIVLNPKYDPHANEINSNDLERIVNDAAEKHKKDPMVDRVNITRIIKHKDMLISSPYAINDGYPVNLHKGIFVSVGTQYLKDNPFEQFLYMTVDTESGEVVKIAGSSLVKHATFLNGKGVSSPDVVTQLREEKKLSEEVINI